MVFSSWRTLPGQEKRSSRSVGLRRQARHRLVFFRREAGDEMARQAARCRRGRSRKRRHHDGEHVQAVIKVFAEVAFARHHRQVAVGGGDDAHIDLDRALGADRIDFAFLQRAQQLDLHVQAQFADLVQEQGAAIGFLEFAQMLVGGAGEGAFLMAEQDGFDQVFREWRRN